MQFETSAWFDTNQLQQLAAGQVYDVGDITYIIRLSNGAFSVATAHITIIGENDGPDAVDDAATTAEDTPVTFSVLANDSGCDNTLTAASITSFTQGAHGSVVKNLDGTFTYTTPDANYNGSDSFTYTLDDGAGGTDTATVTVTVTEVNDAPTANADSPTVPRTPAPMFTVLTQRQQGSGEQVRADPDGDRRHRAAR